MNHWLDAAADVAALIASVVASLVALAHMRWHARVRNVDQLRERIGRPSIRGQRDPPKG